MKCVSQSQWWLNYILTALTYVANYCAAIQVHLLCCEVWGIGGKILHGYVFQWRDVRVQSFVWSHQWSGWLRWLVILCGCSTVERLSFEEFFNHSFMESLRWVFHLCASIEGTESSAQHVHFFLWMPGTNRELAVTKVLLTIWFLPSGPSQWQAMICSQQAATLQLLLKQVRTPRRTAFHFCWMMNSKVL